MRLSILGAGTILPQPGRSPACHLIEIAGRKLVFDLGPGALARLAAAGLDHREIDTVFISHLHPDHVLDLVTLLQATNATPGWERRAPLQLIGCRGLGAFTEALLAIFRDARPETYALEIHELDLGANEIAGLVVHAALTGHTSNSLALRLEAEGQVFVYSGDAADLPALVEIAQDADLFLCEASFPDGQGTPDHLTAAQAARIAARAGVRHLVLTHLYPQADAQQMRAEAEAQFQGPLTIAQDGTEVRA